MSKRIGLYPTLLMSATALVVLSTGTILGLNLATNRAVFSQLAGSVVARSLGGIELAVKAHLDAAVDHADYVAAAVGSGAPGFADRGELMEFAAGSLAAAPQLTAVIIAGADGIAARVVRQKSGEPARSWIDVQQDRQLGPIADRIRRQRGRSWGDPIHRAHLDATVLNLRVPVWRGAQYLGFVGVGISTRELARLVRELSEPPRSTVFVLYGADKVIAHGTAGGPGSMSSLAEPLPAVADIGDPVIAGLHRAVPFRAMGFEPPPGVEASELVAAGIPYLVFSRDLTGYGPVALRVGAYSVAAAVDAPLRTIVRMLGIGAGLIVLSLLAAIGASRLISRPLRETSKSAAAIGALDFEGAAPLRPSRIREIDDLANSFNAMLVGLRAFGRYVPVALVNRLIRENRVGAGTEERELTVMFTDIAGFTGLCEAMSPAEVAAFINRHLTLVSDCIEREGGTIDKYIGDAVMAFWGAPDRLEDGPARAVRAGLRIQDAVAADNHARLAAGLSPVRIRIGIHTGRLIVGDIGAPQRLNYTVVGDVVNVAQRLESLGKEVAPDAESIVLVGRSTRDGLNDTFEVAKVGRFTVKGRHRRLGVYRILGPRSATAITGFDKPSSGSAPAG